MQFRAISQNWASGAQRPPFSALVVALIAGVVLLAPIGHKNDTLIMGSGGYRFGDSWRMGLPRALPVVAVAVPMIAVVWPL